ncbi:PAS domain S-box-containing protein/diguanylate cyclase (GGDEF)-like protein [Prauserella shujinwangii]|uniref:PAS domain S-box-containing protein/diguanylate cyclase (GGDEF)-like protein n=1 Tax=Prauserella shujinwangii TaxID=1453103 RepID=A0A2T0LRA7_9PSEU|nr:GGDEF and EAL domain-containing protein [Prauserella shujinwangii]PRX46004.1 PAS domain S-box-containing protein/diguanylate cyclase (GGDEF)-like protein [Prauserella shujinwangii]
MAEESRAQADAEREALVHRFAAFYDAAPIGVALTDRDGRIVDANPALAKMLGRQVDDLRGTPVTELAESAADAELIRAAFADLGTVRRPRVREPLDLASAEDDVPVRARLTIAGLPGSEREPVYPVLMFEDVSELDLLHETLRRQTVHDQLTGLPNAGSFVNRLEATLAGSADGEQIALVYLDIDGFKVVNDGLGPGAGDEMLRHVARKLRAVFTDHEAFLARLSGDGFAVLLRGNLTSTDVIDLVEEAMAELAEPIYLGGRGVGVSVSVGIVVREAAGQTQEDLHRAAEITLHRAKENGRAQWMLFEPELDRWDRRRYGIGAVIAGGLENGEFEIEYQPTVKLDGSNEIAVVNAALRWNHPEHGQLRPREFYPLADTTGMTLALGRWLLAASLRQAAGWRAEFGPAAPDLCLPLPNRLAIDSNLVGLVRDELKETGFPPGKMRLCADTRALLDPRGEALEALSVLSELDVQIAMVVTGAADLELINAQKLPVGFVVVSGPLVDAFADDEPDAAGARTHLATLLRRCRELGLHRVGAENVRGLEHARRLREVGIVAARGPVFGGPVTSAEVEALIRKNAG